MLQENHGGLNPANDNSAEIQLSDGALPSIARASSTPAPDTNGLSPSFAQDVVIILGPPGSGKGTQAGKICKSHGIPHISTGEMLREAIKAGSDLGLQAKGYMDKGLLVPDDLFIGIIKDRISQADCARGFLLDGFPRTVPQAQALDTLLQSAGVKPRVLELVVPDDVVIQRILDRAANGSGRADDNLETAKARLEVYKQTTALVADYYRQNGGVLSVDATGTIEETHAQVLQAIPDPVPPVNGLN
jgi:adenylate kinase